jgi:hypothetical protein
MQEYKEACFDYKEQIKDLTLRSLNDFSCFYHDLISVYKIPYEDGTIGQPFYSESLFNAWSAYNLLRTMTGKDIAQYPNYIIDYAWLKDLSFQLWKEEIIKVFNQQNSTFADYEQLCTRIYLFGIEEAFKHFAIQTPIPPYISKIGKVLNFNPADNYSPMRQVLYKPGETFNTLYSYNLVRELANKPKVEKAADIDHQWVLEELIKNQTTFCGSQKNLATVEQEKLVNQEREIEALTLRALKGLSSLDRKQPKTEELLDGWCAYRLLKAILEKSEEKLTDYQIDYAWLKNLGFWFWKKRVETLFAEEEQYTDLTFKERVNCLCVLQIIPIFSYVFEVSCFFLKFHPSLSPGECTFVDENYGKSLNKLYSYNLLREYFKESKAEDIEQIDNDWISEILKLDYARLINR